MTIAPAQYLSRLDQVGRVVWINCREEPMIMIDGEPYCVKGLRGSAHIAFVRS